MRRSIRTLLFLTAIGTTLPPPASAQEEERPRRGKIDEVEEEASGDESSPWWLQAIWDTGRVVWHLVTFMAEDHGPGQGYLEYPYADGRALEHFVLSDTKVHRGYGHLSAAHYDDAGSTLSGTHLAWEGARGIVAFGVALDVFREPTAYEVDHLTLVRAGATGVARLNHSTLFRTGLGLRAMILDDGRPALGPEVEIGFQSFPLRPFSFDGTFRFAGLSGAGASWFGTGLLEGSAGAGVLLGRVEVRAGYRLFVIGRATTLAGPTLGARIWL